ncbi:uncharacterized protein N7498_005900 [Penicillium cinerascens]|uniref:Uncharacterized protein n=1 Tax=Penicillium cinerascens TaxID=70096 RepID=A0A9W9MPC5_9EURO|nr:uncharacterized protein N7498_005900 [Penicillium cinerascens]KAJ5205021.1 hypothetical protein N7498_005900 [Penicillium cinerascens]
MKSAKSVWRGLLRVGRLRVGRIVAGLESLLIEFSGLALHATFHRLHACCDGFALPEEIIAGCLVGGRNLQGSLNFVGLQDRL